MNFLSSWFKEAKKADEKTNKNNLFNEEEALEVSKQLYDKGYLKIWSTTVDENFLLWVCFPTYNNGYFKNGWHMEIGEGIEFCTKANLNELLQKDFKKELEKITSILKKKNKEYLNEFSCDSNSTTLEDVGNYLRLCAETYGKTATMTIKFKKGDENYKIKVDKGEKKS